MKIRIQPGMRTDLSLPHPYDIVDDGAVDGQDFWHGDPAALLGFQDRLDVQRVNLLREDWLRQPESAVGKYPVFVNDDGTMWVLAIAVAEVTVFDPPPLA